MATRDVAHSLPIYADFKPAPYEPMLLPHNTILVSTDIKTVLHSTNELYSAECFVKFYDFITSKRMSAPYLMALCRHAVLHALSTIEYPGGDNAAASHVDTEE